MGKYYTGIGSRQTPPNVIAEMITAAIQFSNQGWTLRSGGADGADSAFERGHTGPKEIFLPFANFNRNTSPLTKPTETAFEIAAMIHPVWHKLSKVAKQLMARNVHQVLGQDLNTPSLCVVCWTPDGYNGIQGSYTQQTGGTGMAIELAARNLIPIFNLHHVKDKHLLQQFLEEDRRGKI